MSVEPHLLRLALPLATASSRADLHQAMMEALEPVGARAYALMLFNSSSHGTLAHFRMLEGLPPPFRQLPPDVALARDDPVMQHVRRSSVPIAWDRQTYLNSPVGYHWDFLAECGLGQGAAVALHLTHARHFLIGIEWNRREPLTAEQSARAMEAVQLLAIFAEPAAQRLHNLELARTLDVDTRLSARERECIYYVCRGMTDNLVGQILGISPHTVRQHVEGCIRKLGASNRVEAASLATRLGFADAAPSCSFVK